jgi:hypothetical protein
MAKVISDEALDPNLVELSGAMRGTLLDKGKGVRG